MPEEKTELDDRLTEEITEAAKPTAPTAPGEDEDLAFEIFASRCPVVT